MTNSLRRLQEMNKLILKKIAYQDVWIKGRKFMSGSRDCTYRYEFIREFCTHFNRPITVLDIGANMGYYSIRLAEQFPGTFVMFEGRELEHRYLKQICISNDNARLVTLPQFIDLKQILEISKSFTFDLVLGLSVVHHFSEPFQKVVEGMMQLGSYVMLELPQLDEGLYQGDRVAKEPIDLERYRHEMLARTPYCMDTKRDRYIMRDFYLVETPHHPVKAVEDDSLNVFTDHSFEERRLYNPHTNTFSKGPEGLSFTQFLKFNGSLPSKEWMIDHLKSLDVTDAPSLSPCNIFIFNGELKTYFSDTPPERDAKEDLNQIISLYQNDELTHPNWNHYLDNVKQLVNT
ncbi:MAG: class I SAM-dependent methyltransferase [Parachlamydiales bacterium]|nr:class I SAM-dependent methyltransferase [Parachlamydiales bacterium]